MKDKTIADYMTTSPHSVGFDQPLKHAHDVMREHHIRHLPVARGSLRGQGVTGNRDRQG